jgi:uncharacterized protein (UPF0276 family)
MLMQLFLKIRFAMENVSTYLLSKVNGFPAAQNVAQTQELFEENISRLVITFLVVAMHLYSHSSIHPGF